MKRLTLVFALIVTAGLAFADNGFKVTARGTGEHILSVNIEATKIGDVVRGSFAAKLRTPNGDVELRGIVVRLGPDPQHPKTVRFAGKVHGSNGGDYEIEGMCHDGEEPARDAIAFKVANRQGPFFRGETNRDEVVIERKHN